MQLGGQLPARYMRRRIRKWPITITWNSLPRTVTDNDSLETFKSKDISVLSSIQLTLTLPAASSASEVMT